MLGVGGETEKCVRGGKQRIRCVGRGQQKKMCGEGPSKPPLRISDVIALTT